MTAPRLARLSMIHLVLFTLACIFLFPFVWMLLVAAKTDEEVAANRLPALPTFKERSPYQTGDGQTASLELLGIDLRTRDLRIFKLVSGRDLLEKAVVSGPCRKLVATDAGVRVEYDFFNSRDPVEITYRPRVPLPIESIHKLAISLKPDDSWHRVEVEFVHDVEIWRSTRDTYLAQQRPMTILFQPPSEDDQSLRAKTWIPLRKVGEVPEAEWISSEWVSEIKIRILPSSTARAIYGKLVRNYDRVFRFVPFWKYVGNSLLVAILSVAGMLFSSTFVAYAFARLHWPGRSVAMGLLLSTMMLPPQVTLIPSFVIIRSLDWYNTLNPLWFPCWLGSAFFIFLMIQHLRTIPRELEEAARLDGLGHVQTWYYIMLPQVKPAAAAIAILTFQSAWNDFLGPLIYLRDQSLFTLSLGLYDLQLYSANDQSVIMAGNVLMTLPVMVIFFLFQRYFVAGVTMSGLKG